MAGNGVELVWEGKRREVERVALPFQRVEVINESRATRQSGPLFAAAGRDAAGDDGDAPWRNKLIWGDNKYVLASLLEGDPSIGLESLAGKVDLIYIDPPFATGQDFSFRASVGDVEIEKEPTAIEQVAYRDTWHAGPSSYIQMMYDRLVLARELLTERGTIYVHLGRNVSQPMKIVLDELFGSENFKNEVTWKRSHAHGDTGQGATHFGRVTEGLLIFTKSNTPLFHPQYLEYTDEVLARDYKYEDETTGERYRLMPVDGPGGAAKGNPHYEFLGVSGYWRYSKERMQALYDTGEVLLSSTGKSLSRKKYLRDAKGTPVNDLWDDVNRISPTSAERLDYATQKPESLLRRIINTSSNRDSIVADFFIGSGTAAAVAEKLGRRWVGCDLGRFAIHTTRKRLLGIEGCKPFEVLNLGRYERRYWQGINSGEKIYEYLMTMVRLYQAEPVTGFTHLHGRKGAAMVHIGATDAPVTIAEVRATMEECSANGISALDVLGWEWEMGLNSTGLKDLQRECGVEARLFHIPHEVMDKRAVASGDVHFYEAAYVEAKALLEGGRDVRIELTDFLVAIDDYIRDKVGDKVKKWSDWIDYWAVDFEYNGDIFHNMWQAYRTRKDPKLELTSGAHTYAEAGSRHVLVKVVDIFGNDTTALLEVTV